MTIDELLNDDYITELATDALSDPTSMAALKQNPNTAAFADYLIRNQESWNALLKPIQDQVARVPEFKAAQKAAASFGNGELIPPELLDALNPNWRDIRTGGLTKASPILGVLRTLKDPSSIRGITSLLMEAQATNPARFKELAAMDLGTLNRLGLLDGSVNYKQLEARAATREELATKVQGRSDAEATVALLGKSAAKEVSELSASIKSMLQANGLTSLDDDTSHLSRSVRRAIERIKQKIGDKIDVENGTLSSKYLNSITNTNPAAFWKGQEFDPFTAAEAQELVDEVSVLSDSALLDVQAKTAEAEQQQVTQAQTQQTAETKKQSIDLMLGRPFTHVRTGEVKFNEGHVQSLLNNPPSSLKDVIGKAVAIAGGNSIDRIMSNPTAAAMVADAIQRAPKVVDFKSMLNYLNSNAQLRQTMMNIVAKEGRRQSKTPQEKEFIKQLMNKFTTLQTGALEQSRARRVDDPQTMLEFYHLGGFPGSQYIGKPAKITQ